MTYYMFLDRIWHPTGDAKFIIILLQRHVSLITKDVYIYCTSPNSQLISKRNTM